MTELADVATGTQSPTGEGDSLRRGALAMPEVLAQSVAGMAPTAAMSVNALLAYLAGAGNGTWLSTLLALALMSLVGYAIVQFGRRTTSAGSFYVWVRQGLGPGAGHTAGWALVLGYLATGIATVIGFTLYGSSLLSYFGGPGSSTAVEAGLVLLCTLVAVTVTVSDIRLSARTSLVLEGVSVSIVLLLCVGAAVHHRSVVDAAQLNLVGVKSGGVLSGAVLAIFSFVGFESAASLGMEARNPFRSVRRAVTWSLGGVGLFYVVASYAQVLGFEGSKPGFAHTSAPLPGLAHIEGLSFLVPVIDAGVAVSMFACAMACINAGARILYSMAADGMGHQAVGKSHARHQTPHVAIVISAVPMLLVPLAFTVAGFNLVNVDGWVGTLATFGFMLAYALVSLAAPVFLGRRNEPNGLAWVLGATATVAMAIVFYANWLPKLIPNSIFSALAYPYDILPYVFMAWLLVGFGWFAVAKRRKPDLLVRIGTSHMETATSTRPSLVAAASEA